MTVGSIPTDIYRNVLYMGQLQDFKYLGTQENPFGKDIFLYNGEPDHKGQVATLSSRTIETLIEEQTDGKY